MFQSSNDMILMTFNIELELLIANEALELKMLLYHPNIDIIGIDFQNY